MLNLAKFQNTSYKKAALSLLMAAFLVFTDIFLKKFVLKNLIAADIRLFNNIFKLSLEKNTGIAFSIALPPNFLNLFIAITIVLLLIYYYKQILKNNHREIPALTFIITGAIMNYVDRLRFGYVIDYFNLKWFTVFNLADCMIFCGFCFLVLTINTAKK